MPIDALRDPRRTDPPLVAGEREMLEAWLDFHRATLLLKCEGLDDVQRKARPVASSLMSLHGLVRHMADVERGWFRRTLLQIPVSELPPLYWRRETEDLDWVPLDDADFEADLAAWQRECDEARAAAASLDIDHVVDDDDLQFSLRWIYVHMIEEYARHNGHADLIREMVDGAVGD
jgi:uncharacterized damage-inducible protein DinB